MRKTCLAACAAILLLPLNALAESETVVVTATRTPEAASTLPASVTIIDRATIEARGFVTLADALSDVPGLHLVQAGNAGSVASVFVRGANSNQVLVLRDGVPLNDPGDPGGAFNFGVDTLGDIERIEIVRGPMSSVYGSGAVGGVINLISRKAAAGWHGHASLAAGLPRALAAHGDASLKSGKWDLSASADSTSERGFDNTPARETLVYSGERDGYRQASGQVEAGYNPAANTRIFLRLRGRAAKYGYDTYQLDAGNATGEDNSLLATLGLSTQLLDGRDDTTLALSRLQTDRRYIQTLDARDPNLNSEDDRYGGRRNTFEWNNIIHMDQILPWAADRLTFGYAHVNDTSRSSIVSNGLYGPYESNVAAHADTDQVNLGWQKRIGTRLSLTAQLRQDWTSLAGDQLTWRIGASLAVPEIDTRLHAAYGTGFRAPALFDRYGVDSYGFVGNPQLRAEHAEGGEIGLDHDMRIGGTTAALHLTGFANRTRDLISFTYAPIYTTVNIGTARIRGLETSFDLRASRYATLTLNYTWLDAQDGDTHSGLLRRPRHSAGAAMIITPLPPLRIVPQLRYTGAFLDYITDSSGSSASLPDYARAGWIFDLSAAWKLSPQSEIFIDGKNLGNSHFEPASGYQTPGASFLAGYRTGF